MRVTPEARELLSAFKDNDTRQQVEQVGVLVVEDGFDADSVRLLSAWMHADAVRWSAPTKAVPDGGRPTPRAWAWLVAGMKVDNNALADAAGVTRPVARQKLARLIAVRLVYPDGTIAKAGRVVIEAAIAERAGKRGRSAPKDKAPKTDERKPQVN